MSGLAVGTVRRAEAREPALLELWVDLRDREVRSAARLGDHHDADALVGEPVLVTPAGDVPDGGVLYRAGPRRAKVPRPPTAD